jgi:hypothetical protein
MTEAEPDNCICGWYVEPHGELMIEPEPDCKVHFPNGDKTA